MAELDPDVIVHSVVFGAQGVEISYMESRHRTDHGHRIQTIVVDPAHYEDDIIELVGVIEQLIDRYAVDERRPPDSIRGR